MSHETFEQQLRIDLFHLEVELESSPTLCFAASSAVDEAMKKFRDQELEVKKCEDIIKRAKAEACSAFRLQCETTGGKYTDGQAEVYYRQNHLHQQAKANWLEALKLLNSMQAEVDKAKSIMFSVYKRDGNLKELVRLYLGNYFTGPSAPHDLEEMKRSIAKPTSAIRAAVDNEISQLLNEEPDNTPAVGHSSIVSSGEPDFTADPNPAPRGNPNNPPPAPAFTIPSPPRRRAV